MKNLKVQKYTENAGINHVVELSEAIMKNWKFALY